jgi:hypothetical protein
MVWEAKAENFIQVNYIKKKNKVTWHKKKHKGQSKLGKILIPKDMGNGSTQPTWAMARHNRHDPSRWGQSHNTNHISKTHKLSSPQGEAKGLDTTNKRAKEHTTHKLPLNTCTMDKEYHYKKPCDPWRYSHDVFRFRHRSHCIHDELSDFVIDSQCWIW